MIRKNKLSDPILNVLIIMAIVLYSFLAICYVGNIDIKTVFGIS